MSSDNPMFDRMLQREAAKQYFLRIRPAISSGNGPRSEKVSELNNVLQPYEEALVVDATEYRERPLDHLISDRKFLLWGDITHFQFLAGDTNEWTAWVVEMGVEKLKDTTLWRPKETRFTRIVSSRIPSLRRLWSSSGYFLHPRLGEGYNMDVLNRGVLSTTRIITDNNGMITGINYMEHDGIVGIDVLQRITLDRNYRPSDMLAVTGIYSPAIRGILENLPLEKSGGVS